MATFDAAGTPLILPDGTEIAPDEKGVDLNDILLQNEGVKSWIKEGLLVAVAKKAVTSKGKK